MKLPPIGLIKKLWKEAEARQSPRSVVWARLIVSPFLISQANKNGVTLGQVDREIVRLAHRDHPAVGKAQSGSKTTMCIQPTILAKVMERGDVDKLGPIMVFRAYAEQIVEGQKVCLELNTLRAPSIERGWSPFTPFTTWEETVVHLGAQLEIANEIGLMGIPLPYIPTMAVVGQLRPLFFGWAVINSKGQDFAFHFSTIPWEFRQWLGAVMMRVWGTIRMERVGMCAILEHADSPIPRSYTLPALPWCLNTPVIFSQLSNTGSPRLVKPGFSIWLSSWEKRFVELDDQTILCQAFPCTPTQIVVGVKANTPQDNRWLMMIWKVSEEIPEFTTPDFPISLPAFFPSQCSSVASPV